MAVSVVRSDGWIQSIETNPVYAEFFQNHRKKKLPGNPFDPEIYKHRFRGQDFTKMMWCVESVIKRRKSRRVIVNLKCNQCGDTNNKWCYRIAKVFPHKKDRVLIYSSVVQGTCKLFDRINRAI